MGNALLRFICGGCGGETPRTDDVSALVHDLHQFDITSQVPDGLGQHVVSSKKAQANWYKKLSEAWSEARPPPRTPEEAARLIVQTLKRHQHADVKGLLAFYGLPFPDTTTETTPTPASSAKPVAIKFELHTLPVDLKSIADGDTVTVYVNVKDPREASTVPREVRKAAAARDKARARKDYKEADAIHKTIISAGYRVVKGSKDEEILAKKYRIRLSGIDAPESAMPYGKEATDELVKLILGHPLKIYVYTTDQYGRSVGDIYCNGVFIQEKLLRGGWAWHYTAYDKRPDLAMWEKEARAARVGLWASANPEKPWDWRRERRNRA